MNPIPFPTRRHVGTLVGSALLGLALAPATAQTQAPAWPSPSLSSGTTTPNGINDIERCASMFDGPANTLPMVRAGKVKVLAVRGAKRNPALPEVPTFAEQGYPTLDDTATIVLWSWPDVPADVQARIRSSALKARLLEFGLDQGSGATPEELTKVMRAAYDKQGATLRALGVNPKDLGG